MPEENPQENSNMSNSHEVYEPEDFEQREIERLKQEILDREKKIAEKMAEKEKEAKAEGYRPEIKEGVISQERTEVGSLPPAPVVSAQIQRQSQQISLLAPQNQVESLCDLAFQRGLDFAIKTARNLNNPYVLDAFHDALVDKLYKRLILARQIGEL
ncbi:MAG: hypothetical protein HY813_00985 [Candidatus Portnoybacteria bacterium]|nr:hypothetical protein [Candidatus Portnoybacteria bacterium]